MQADLSRIATEATRWLDLVEHVWQVNAHVWQAGHSRYFADMDL